MRLTQRITADGERLFRLRSFAPFVLAPLMLVALYNLGRFELKWGWAAEEAWLVFCLLIGLVGLGLRCLTIGFAGRGTSGRGTTTPSALTLNIDGMYSVVRNPLYLANGIMLVAVAMATATWWFAAVMVLAYWLYIERIIAAEEAFLATQFGEAFGDWVRKTPCFWPRFSQWRAPDLSFSPRTVLRREYPGFMALTVAFALVELISDVVMEGEPFRRWLITDREWASLFVFGIVFGLLVRTMKKLHLLDVPNR
jgi:protein-S-isoprenylcysteine O-methyltransferase Ste14